MAKYDNEKIVDMYRAGEKVDVIAAVVGCHFTNVSLIANSAGLRRRTVTDQTKRNKNVVSDYRSGKLVHEIAKTYEMSTKTVYRVLNKMQEPLRVAIREAEKKESKRKIADAYARGDKVAAIAAEFGVCDTTPMKCALSAGHKKRRPDHRIKSRSTELAIVSAYVCTKKTLNEIASEFGVSESCVSDTLNRNCIDRDRKFKRYASISILE